MSLDKGLQGSVQLLQTFRRLRYLGLGCRKGNEDREARMIPCLKACVKPCVKNGMKNGVKNGVKKGVKKAP